MVRSMTGFGRGEAVGRDIRISVELSCVNRKQLDCVLSLPRDWLMLEPGLQAIVRKRFSRGYIKGTVAATFTGTPKLSDSVRQQIESIRQTARELSLPDTLGSESLLRLPELLRIVASPEEIERYGRLAEEAVANAVDAVDAMRMHEGDALAADIRQRLAMLVDIRAGIAVLAAEVPPYYREQLRQRLEVLMPAGLAVNEEILARELAVFADRCDISEELTRLTAHFAHAEKLLSGGEPCGRAMDFLCQEFFREINTTGSKANSSEITRLVIQFKTGLEAIREQVQNLE